MWLFGSQARGDWDGYSDTDLLVVAADAAAAAQWAAQLRRSLVGAMAGSPSPHWRTIRRQACFFAAQAAEKALKGAIVELGLEPPHCPCGP